MDSAKQPTIVVINDDPVQLHLTSELLEKDEMKVDSFQNAEEALHSMVENSPPGLIITDLNMPGIDGWSLCKLLRSPEYAAFNMVPILVLSDTYTGAEAEEITAAQGADAFLAIPYEPNVLKENARALLEGRPVFTSQCVLIVDDDKGQVKILEHAFRKRGFSVVTANTVSEGRQQFLSNSPDLVVLDYYLPDTTGDTLLDDIKKPGSSTVVVMITADNDPERALQLMKKGVDDYVRKPFTPKYLINLYEKARRQRALKESEIRLRTLFENAGDAILIADADAGKIINANKKAEELLGCPRSEIIGIHKSELRPPDKAEYYKEHFCDHVRQGPLEDNDAEIIRKDGTIVPVNISTSVMELPGRKVVQGIFRDITERKRAEKELKHQAFLLENVSDAIISTDMDFVIQSWNRAAEKMYGWQAVEVTGKPLAEIVKPEYSNDSRKSVFQTFPSIIQTFFENGHYEGEVLHHHKDGTPINIWGSVSMLKGADGKPYGTVSANRNITERKKVEEALARERDFSRQLIDTAQAIILVLDTEGKIVNFNPYMEEISGYKLEEVKGKDWFETFLPDRDLELLREIFKHGVEDIQTRGNVNPIVTKDGREIYIEWYDKTLKDQDGNVLGLLAVGQDITERKQAEETLLQYQNQIRQLASDLTLAEEKERQRAGE